MTCRSLVAVRTSAESDLAMIQRIYAHEVLNGLATFEEVPPSVEELARRRDAVLHQGLPYLVALLDEGVVGYAYASHHRPRPAYRYCLEDTVYVAPDCRARGVGSALLRALIDHCAGGPWRQMVAVIGDRENAGAIRLHEQFGFRHVGTLHAVGFKLGRWVDTVMMQRPLGEGSATLPQTVR